MNRRRFLILAAAAAVGCSRREEKPVVAKPTSQPVDEDVIDAGPVDEFKSEGVYSQFRERGFFVMRREKQLFVLSAICTHKGCKVRLAEDQSFFCKCHGSTFDRNGKVTKGPAIRDLPRFSVRVDEQDHLEVRKTA